MKTMKSLEKTFTILECFKDREQLSLAEIHQLTKIPKTSVHEILTTLKLYHFVNQHDVTKNYSLGIAFLEYGGLYSKRNSLKNVADSFCIALSNKYQATVHLTIPNDGEVIYIGKYEHAEAHVSVSNIGAHLPMSCTGVGKAMLAFMGEDYLQKYVLSKPLLTPTANSISNESDLRKDLSLTQSRGYATDDEESILGIRCIAAPVFDPKQQVIGAVSVTRLAPTINETNFDIIRDDVLEAARKISIGATGNF